MLLILIFTFVCFFLLAHYALFIGSIYSGLKRLTQEKCPAQEDYFVSVIIPFRNESGSIINSVKSLSDQIYPAEKFEVIYINDNSTDDSPEKWEKTLKPGNFRILNFNEADSAKAFKKRAVDFGIRNSKGDIIVTTDADCTHNPKWLSSIIQNFDKRTALVTGPVDFVSDGSLFDEFQKLEFEGLILAGAGLIGMNNPVICSAANLAFKREAFEKVGGYADNYNLSSGDDELLMQKIFSMTDYEIKFSASEQSLVKTLPNKNISGFIGQRRRWSSKGLFYKNKFLVFSLILIFLFYLFLPLQLLLGIFYNIFFIISFAAALVIKMFVEALVLIKGKALFFDDLKIRLLPIAELLQIPYIIITPVLGLFGNFRWKGRKLKR